MRGVIKLVHENGYGFIPIEGKADDAHFRLSDFVGPSPSSGDEDRAVEFELIEDDQGLHAKNIRLLDERSLDVQPWERPGALGRALTFWAHFPRTLTSPTSGQTLSTVERLREITLSETWHFGDAPPSEEPFPILWNYLLYTFVRLSKQDIADGLSPQEARLRVSADGQWATFNTGLVDQLYDPVFALFEKAVSVVGPPWSFHDFCVPGQGRSGKQLTAVFNPLPPQPKYFTRSSDMLLDTEQDINFDAAHVIVEGVKRDRFPYEFLRQNLEPRPPAHLAWKDYSTFDHSDRADYLNMLAEALEQDPQAQRSIKNRLEDAKALAVKRTKCNYKTAIPSYYPRLNEMNLILPLCLVDDEIVDASLIISRLPSGVYQGHTIFPLNWAYQNARLVARPDSDWLLPERISADSPDDAADDIDESPAAPVGDPWNEFVEANKVDNLVTGTVKNLVPFGAFINLADGVRGMIHISNLSEGWIEHPSDVLSEGDSVTVRIIGVDRDAQKIDLSLSDVGSDENET